MLEGKPRNGRLGVAHGVQVRSYNREEVYPYLNRQLEITKCGDGDLLGLKSPNAVMETFWVDGLWQDVSLLSTKNKPEKGCYSE